MAQLELSRRALEAAREATDRDGPRLGYFSGTRTHQADFRLIAAVLVRLLDEFPAVRLVVAGDFDLAEFPDFGRFPGRVEERPFVDWRLLPAEIARVDVNLIPLEVNPFTEGKSNLKYYEAALLEVPSVATPARAYRECITHGINGLLAQGADDWYAALRSLIVDPALRRQIGAQARRHALREYVPSVIADEALTAYRDMLRQHRRDLGVADDAPTVVVLLSDLGRALRDRSPVLPLCDALVQAGASLTVHLPEGPDRIEAAQALESIAEHGFEPSYAVEVGGEVPGCDLLLATDSRSARRAKRFERRARWTAYLVSEYEPAYLPYGAGRERARESYQLGLELLAFDPTLADLLARHHGAEAKVLPPWVESRPIPIRECHDPTVLLVAATSSLPDHAWDEAVAALDRTHANHPEVRIVLVGDAAPRGALAGLPYAGLDWPLGEAFADLLAERPVCVVLFATGQPRWVFDLMAAGCPVIAASSCPGRRGAGPELEEGFVTAPADAGALAAAIDSLLIDRVRMSALTYRAAERVREMADARMAAQMLLRASEVAVAARLAARPPDHRDGRIPDDPVARVAVA